MGYKVEEKELSELPEDHQMDFGYNEEAMYLCIYKDGKLVEVYSDQYEPEDVSFLRSLRWVKKELERAYNYGFIDGQN